MILGNVLQAGQGQNPARIASIKGGLPESVPAFTVNKVCGSGLKSIQLAYQSILAGDNDVVLAGGMESMSQSPMLMKNARFGFKMGNQALVDSMVADGLTDVFNDYHMGITAENLVEKYSISREAQDEFAAQSQQKQKPLKIVVLLMRKSFQSRYHNAKENLLSYQKTKVLEKVQQLIN